MFWEHSPNWTIIASDWLRAELSCEWRRKKIKNGWWCCEVLHLLQRELVYLLTCGRRSLVSETQNEIVVSWITLWGVMKVYWLDFSLHFGSCCLLRVCRKFGPKLASHYKPVENEVKLDRPNHIRQTKSSIKKRIIVRRSVRSMFGEQTFAQLRTGYTVRGIGEGVWCRLPYGEGQRWECIDESGADPHMVRDRDESV